MKVTFIFLLFATILSVVVGQRSYYAGSKPIGYPELGAQFGTEEPPSSTESIVNRFGDDGQPIRTTTLRMPVDALGDRELIKKIQTWPRDKWPFWYVNYVAIEEHRNQRPGQTQAGPTTPTGQTTTGVQNQPGQVVPATGQRVPTTGQRVPGSGQVQTSQQGQGSTGRQQTWDRQNWSQQRWNQQNRNRQQGSENTRSA